MGKRGFLEVENIDLGYGNDGKYKEIYRGKYVFEQSTGNLYYFYKDGMLYSCWPWMAGSGDDWTPREAFEVLKKAEEQASKSQGSEVKIGVVELMALKQQFNVEEIANLRRAGLL